MKYFARPNGEKDRAERSDDRSQSENYDRPFRYRTRVASAVREGVTAIQLVHEHYSRNMIVAKYRRFSAEPKASKFPRYAHTEEVAVLGISIWSPKEWLIPICWPPCPGEKRRTFNCRASEDDLIEARGPRQDFCSRYSAIPLLLRCRN